MKYEIHITRSAETDLNSSADYIEFVLFNPSVADALLDEAETQISSLESNPYMYAEIDDPLLKAWTLRHIKVKNYIAFYQVSEEEKRVYIVRFLYGKRDWITILKTSLPLQRQTGEIQ